MRPIGAALADSAARHPGERCRQRPQRENLGGGYGDPWQRDPARMVRGVARGCFTAKHGRRDYGMELTAADRPRLDRGASDQVRRGGRSREGDGPPSPPWRPW